MTTSGLLTQNKKVRLVIIVRGFIRTPTIFGTVSYWLKLGWRGVKQAR